MSYIQISWSKFEEQYKPIQNHIDTNAALDGCMFESYGDEILHILKADPDTVWTYLETDNNPILTNGFHYVNRIGYVLTENSYPENSIIEVIDEN